MNNGEGNSLKTAILIAICVLAGVLLTLGIQWLTPSGNKGSESANSRGEPDIPPVAPGAAKTSLAANYQAPPEPNTAQQAPIVINNTGHVLESGETVSGYPINTGRKAVDYGGDPVAGSGSAMVVDENGVPYDQRPAQPIMRNGLIGNPSVDPASSHGAAYNRSYTHAPQ